MLLILTIILPIVAGLLLVFFNFNKVTRNIYILVFTCLTSLLTIFMIINKYDGVFQIVRLNNIFNISLKIDNASSVFSLLVSLLWPLATIYAFEYMNHEENQTSFFRYYMIAYGITLGVAFSSNLITMYLFYEILTFVTLPLIMHKNDKDSIYAGRIYLILSILGASMALIGIIIYSTYISNNEFLFGGHIDLIKNNILYIAYGLCFFGFGVKAAILPFSFWLPKCSVAPTPVTALLHAVAVVKSGVFAIIRVTYFSFGIDFLKGSYIQYLAMTLSIITILFGSIMAVREKHLKRRFAYSTISNLSYILFMITIMSKQSLNAAFIHMFFHGITKILLFFVIGAIMVYTGSNYIEEIKGYAKNMKVTFISFIIASLALIGIPLTCGFISKYNIAIAVVEDGSILSLIGLFAIIISALLTAIYTFTIIIAAYFPNTKIELDNKKIHDPGIFMLIAFIILSILIIYFGIFNKNLIDMINNVSNFA